MAINYYKNSNKNDEIRSQNVESLKKTISEVRGNLGHFLARLEAEKQIKEDINISPSAKIHLDIKEKTLNKSITELRSYNDQLLDEIQLAQKRLTFFEELGKVTSRNIIISPTKGITSQATAFMIGSDWHLEEKIDPLTVNGLNEYTVDIAKDSAANFFSNGLRLVQIMQKDVHIDTIVLGILGDIINGYIHEEFLEDNYLSPTEASLVGLDLICSGIDYLLKNSKCKMKVVFKYGNHGRTTQKMRISTAYKNSFEWMMFKIVMREFEKNERVEMTLDNSYLTYVNVYGKDIRFHHGDAIK